MKLEDEIGFPALLEMVAEENVELAHACLKLSRKYRQENPTPKSYTECFDALFEEIADVILCLNELLKSVDPEDVKKITAIKNAKQKRMEERLQKNDSH